MPLKVFRTAIGFHDAYVAAPSQKAALAAWGADKDLFARGAAELVNDPALAAEPLARPGAVIKRLRGTAEEQLAAAPAVARTAKKQDASTPRSPRPDRRAVKAAEEALAAAQARQQAEEQALAAEEAKLAERRRALRAAHAEEAQRLEAARDVAERTYADALRAWRDA